MLTSFKSHQGKPLVLFHCWKVCSQIRQWYRLIIQTKFILIFDIGNKFIWSLAKTSSRLYNYRAILNITSMTKLSKEKAVYFHKFSIYFRMFGMRRKQIQIATIETNISLQNPLKNGKIHDVTYGDITSPPFVNRVQSTFCQSSPVHLLLIESSPPFVSPVQSTFCHMPFFPVFLIALFTACNILINETNVLLICLKILCLKNVMFNFFVF